MQDASDAQVRFGKEDEVGVDSDVRSFGLDCQSAWKRMIGFLLLVAGYSCVGICPCPAGYLSQDILLKYFWWGDATPSHKRCLFL